MNLTDAIRAIKKAKSEIESIKKMEGQTQAPPQKKVQPINK